MAYIVAVEDNEDVAEVVSDALRSEGHRCFVIRSKAGAGRFFRRVRPDLVVLDCLLVGGDRLQLAKKLGSQVNVPVIVTSGDIEKAEQAGRWTWTEFALDSALEEDGFELAVPRKTP